MISILITYAFHNMSIKLAHKLRFLIKLNNLKGLEYTSGTQLEKKDMPSKLGEHIEKHKSVQVIPTTQHKLGYTGAAEQINRGRLARY